MCKKFLARILRSVTPTLVLEMLETLRLWLRGLREVRGAEQERLALLRHKPVELAAEVGTEKASVCSPMWVEELPTAARTREASVPRLSDGTLGIANVG